MVVIIERSDSVSVLVGQVGPTDRDIWQFCIKTLTVDLLITLVQVHVVDGFTRVSVATAEKNYHHGNCGDRDLEEAAHLKRVIGVSFGRNSTDVLFEWPAKNFVLMGRDCLAKGQSLPAPTLLFQIREAVCQALGDGEFFHAHRHRTPVDARLVFSSN